MGCVQNVGERPKGEGNHQQPGDKGVDTYGEGQPPFPLFEHEQALIRATARF